MDWLDGAGPGTALKSRGGEHTIFDFSMGADAESGQQGVGIGGRADWGGLATALWVCAGFAGNIRGGGPLSGHQLSSGQLDSIRANSGPGADGSAQPLSGNHQEDLCLSVSAG